MTDAEILVFLSRVERKDAAALVEARVRGVEVELARRVGSGEPDDPVAVAAFNILVRVNQEVARKALVGWLRIDVPEVDDALLEGCVSAWRFLRRPLSIPALVKFLFRPASRSKQSTLRGRLCAVLRGFPKIQRRLFWLRFRRNVPLAVLAARNPPPAVDVPATLAAVQKSVAAAFADMPPFRGDSQFYSFLVTIALRYLRRLRQEAMNGVPWETLANVLVAPAQSARRFALGPSVRRLLRKLPPRQRKVILLQYVGRLSAQECAERLSVSTGAIFLLRLHARENLRRLAGATALGASALGVSVADSFLQKVWHLRSPCRELRAFVASWLRKLKKDFRQVIWFRFARGKPPQQIAEKLGVPLGEVKARLESARAIHREFLASVVWNNGCTAQSFCRVCLQSGFAMRSSSSEWRPLLAAALRYLQRGERRVVWLCAGKKLDIPDIVKVTGASEKDVATSLDNAGKNLRLFLLRRLSNSVRNQAEL